MTNSKVVTLISAAIGGLAAALAIVLGHPFSASTQKQVLVRPSGGTTFASQLTATAPLTPREIYERDARGVVSIRATSSAAPQSLSPFGAEQGRQTDTGTGIVLSTSGLIVTNDHVVERAGTITVSLNGSSGQTRQATVIAKDPAHDLALLKISPNGLTLHPLSLANSSTTQVGDPAYAIGNPFGLNWTLTTGVVSALNRQIKAPDEATISHVIQTDAALNPGNSGGPLINASGAVIGVNSQIASASSSGGQGGSTGVGFAISSNTVKGFLQGAHAGI